MRIMEFLIQFKKKNIMSKFYMNILLLLVYHENTTKTKTSEILRSSLSFTTKKFCGWFQITAQSICNGPKV